jgi:hypothetical protein
MNGRRPAPWVRGQTSVAANDGAEGLLRHPWRSREGAAERSHLPRNGREQRTSSVGALDQAVARHLVWAAVSFDVNHKHFVPDSQV